MSIYTLLASTAVTGNTRLWVLDENLPFDAVGQLGLTPEHTVLSNRFDIHQHISDHTPATSRFSDFQFADLSLRTFEVIYYRVSKERPITNKVLNQCAQALSIGGTLVIAGEKGDGIKGYYEKTVKQLGFYGQLEKHNNNYRARLTRTNSSTTQLDDKQYDQLREVGRDDMGTYISKPGVYGWNKIDEGSKLLRQALLEITSDRNPEQHSFALDLGSGYGFLSVGLVQAGFQNIWATDNNAAAIAATRATLETNNCTGFTVIPDDCGQSIQQSMQCIVCNPPFHQGFDVASSLTEKFVLNAKHLLSPKGVALFVVNAFIPLEKVAQPYFDSITCLVNNRKFKVICLRNR